MDAPPKTYVIIESRIASELELHLDTALKDGWVVCGGIALVRDDEDGILYAQAITHHEADRALPLLPE